MWSIIPEKNGIPLVKWSKYMEEAPAEGELSFPVGCGFGLICGQVSNVVALDIDSDIEETKIMALIDGAGDMKAKRGGKGRTILFKYSGEPNKSWKKDGRVICELLSDKRKTTIPPSPYKDVEGKYYEWINEEAELTELPSNFVDVMEALYPAPTRKIRTYDIEFTESVEMDEAHKMLGFIPPDCSRDEWLAIGMGLRDEFGDAAFPLWDQWSQGSQKYKPKEMACVWRSFNGGGVSIASVIHYAQEGGYVRAYEKPSFEEYTIDLSYLDEKKVAERKEIVAHGLVGMIADWITSTAIRPQPQLALGAALTFVGMLKGHKYTTPTGLRSNLLVMNVAPTAAGKEHPQACISRLLKACELEKNEMSLPTSGTGLLTGLQKCNRVGLLSVDEMGRFLGNIANKNSGGYQREIIDYIIQMFSRANGRFVGRQYANEKINPTVKLVNPHLCVIGSSVKGRISESCSSAEVIDGFLNRWIFFETSERPPMREDMEFSNEVPPEIIFEVQKIINDDPNGYYPVAEDAEPLVKTIRYTPEARAVALSYGDKVEGLLNTAVPPLDALYARCREHVAKLALILCDNEFVRERDVELAIDIVSESNKMIVDFAGLISDNDKEAEILRVLDIIKSRKSLTRRELVQATRFLGSAKRLSEVVSVLEAGEDIKIVPTSNGKSYTVHIC